MSPQANGNGGASFHGPNSDPQPMIGKPEQLRSQSGNGNGNGNAVYKSGPLFISSKGIGWTSWKKRWFILTHSSLVFFRSDPNVVSQKGSEVNLTLGGIDLNNSGSVVVKADKKLLTVQFPDIRDGRAFTLKAETTEDLYAWKTALEDALAKAPSAGNVKGQNGTVRNDQTDSRDISLDRSKDRRDPVKFRVTGRPILLALEDVDGTPSFLEKALRFIEEHGAKVEGILRQAADVEHVKYRVQEYEEGKVEFTKDEDAHVIADCVKYVIREFPSSPVPASCCKALLEACRNGRVNRVSAMRVAIWDTFPEPNRCLLQRILLMMQVVASHKAVNKMSSSAVAACMAPLLLRPLLAGDCEIENDFDVGGDDSIQLLQAAAAANHAQAIVITLLEEYNGIFGQEGSEYPGPEMFSDSEESRSESEEATDDDLYYDDDDDYYSDDEQDESIQESDVDAEDDIVSETGSETGDSLASDEHDDKDHDLSISTSKSSKVIEDPEVDQILPSTSLEVSPQCKEVKSCENVKSPIKNANADESNQPVDIVGGLSTDQTTMHKSNCPSSSSFKEKSTSLPNEPAHRRRTVFGRTSAKKNLSMERTRCPDEDESEIERLEAVKTELQNQITEEVKESTKLQSDVEKRKKALQERRLTLERDVTRLQEQLQKEKTIRVTLEAGLKLSPGPFSDLSCVDEKTMVDLKELVLIEVDLANLEQKIDELGARLDVQLEQNYGSMLDCVNQIQQISNQERNLKNQPDSEIAALLQYEMSISKDTHFTGAENLSERMPESAPLPTFKKSGTRGEGANSNSSTLTKLSAKLSFLKDRRNPEFKQKVSDLLVPLPSPKKSGGYELHLPPPSPSKSRTYDFYLPLLSPKSSKSRGYEKQSPKGAGKEGQPLQHPERLTKSDSQPGNHCDRQNQHPPLYLRRGKSEGHHHS
ncbi:hypothetical protein RIF29_16957 [Crotalaria pallida]|uniref:Rho GTPase-activating protein REN1-like n=1 Tax=Crotalaria pallida TaxID=3830 RepID=A0AAN9FG92_CROPI